MPAHTLRHSRRLTVIAQDPSFTHRGDIVTSRVEVPAESLSPGPTGYRVQVVDYDASTGHLYKSLDGDLDGDPYRDLRTDTDRLLADPHFHQHNVYAVAMATLGRFEQALGRRVSWNFTQGGHQLKIVPHAFAEANAYYSRHNESLLFGYFGSAISGERIFTCLSHDIVVHETVHALLDGLRPRFSYPSSPDQAAFHEGFSDIVAILSVFSLPEVLEQVFFEAEVTAQDIEPSSLRRSALLKLAEEMGQELSRARGQALRQSVRIDPEAVDLGAPEYQQPHRRGEVLVAAVLRTFVEIWSHRLKNRHARGGAYNRVAVMDAGTTIASRLLTAVIRAIDFTPPVDLSFGDFLSATLTADLEVNPDDEHRLRETMRYEFGKYGIMPSSSSQLGDGMWEPSSDMKLSYAGLHHEALQYDRDEIFRFVWDNRKALDIYPAFTKVQSVRPSVRISESGAPIRETVAEYVQTLMLRAEELTDLNLRKPSNCPLDAPVKLYGGGALVFDQFGKLRLHIRNRLHGSGQQERLDYLWKRRGTLTSRPTKSMAQLHRDRAMPASSMMSREAW